MDKTLLFRLFGLGKIPADAVPQINREGLLLSDEGIGGSITLKNYRAPGKYAGWQRSWFSGSVVMTRKHLLAFRYSRPVIGVAWDHAEIRQLQCSVDDKNRLCFAFEASVFDEQRSGAVELRYRTAKAHDFLHITRKRSRRAAG